MLLHITEADIGNAIERTMLSAAGRKHSRYHPIAIALERQLGEGTIVSITLTRAKPASIHIFNTRLNINRVIQMPVQGIAFQRLWVEQRAKPTAITLYGI